MDDRAVNNDIGHAVTIADSLDGETTSIPRRTRDTSNATTSRLKTTLRRTLSELRHGTFTRLVFYSEQL